MTFRTASGVICLVCWLLFVPRFFCETTSCHPPDFPEGGTYKPKIAVYHVGQNITYSCIDRLLRWDRVRPVTCLSTGKWSENTPFCDKRTKIKNPVASSSVDSSESAIVDGDINTCFRTRHGKDEFITVTLDHPAVVYAVAKILPKGSKGSFRITISKNKNISSSDKILCETYSGEREKLSRFQTFCKSTDVKAEFVTIQVSPGIPGSIWVCDIEVYTKDGEWCDEPPKNLVANSQLEVSRSRAILSCNDVFAVKDNRRLYATCEKGRWLYRQLQCTEEKHLVDFKAIAIALGAVAVLLILIFLGVTVFLARKTKIVNNFELLRRPIS